MENKVVFKITRETLLEVGVDPDSIVEKIELMNALDVKPTYIKGYLTLTRDQRSVSS